MTSFCASSSKRIGSTRVKGCPRSYSWRGGIIKKDKKQRETSLYTQVPCRTVTFAFYWHQQIRGGDTKVVLDQRHKEQAEPQLVLPAPDVEIFGSLGVEFGEGWVLGTEGTSVGYNAI